MTTRRAAKKLALACAVLALAAAFSCKTFDLPNEICDPAGLHTGRVGRESADEQCTRCLEENCCDAVGVCERKDGCPELVRSIHECVLDAGLQGTAEEGNCVRERKLISPSEANDAYRCMRDSCGEPCGLPVCRVNQAAVLVATARCDQCFSGSCCPEINACYGSRACKLMMECVATECRGVLGASLIDDGKDPFFAARSEGRAEMDVARICADGGGSEFPGPACLLDCLCRFQANDQGLPAEDLSKRPFVLAASIYECGVKAGCGPKCVIEADASTDGAGAKSD